MKKGFIYRLIYGKGRADDFSLDDLPKNRWQQFLWLMRNRFGVIFRANLLCAPFWILLLLWDLICGAYVGDFTAGMEASQQFSYLLNLTLLQYGTDAVLLGIAFCGLSGLFYVMRRLCWGQPVKVVADFFKGVKNSGRQFFGIGFLLGIVVWLMVYLAGLASLTTTSNNAFVWTVSVFLCFVAIIVATIASVIACAQASLYNVKFITLIFNSLKLTFKRLFQLFAVCLATVFPFVLCWMLPWAVAKFAIACVILTVGLGYAVCGQNTFCLGVFDLFINQQSYPDFVRMGLSGGKSIMQVEQSATEKDDNANNKQ